MPSMTNGIESGCVRAEDIVGPRSRMDSIERSLRTLQRRSPDRVRCSRELLIRASDQPDRLANRRSNETQTLRAESDHLLFAQRGNGADAQPRSNELTDGGELMTLERDAQFHAFLSQ